MPPYCSLLSRASQVMDERDLFDTKVTGNRREEGLLVPKHDAYKFRDEFFDFLWCRSRDGERFYLKRRHVDNASNWKH